MENSSFIENQELLAEVNNFAGDTNLFKEISDLQKIFKLMDEENDENWATALKHFLFTFRSTDQKEEHWLCHSMMVPKYCDDSIILRFWDRNDFAMTIGGWSWRIDVI